MKINKKAIGIICGVLVTVVTIGTGVTAYAAQNPDSALGQLIFSTEAVSPSDFNTTDWVVIDENGNTRAMTEQEKSEIKSFSQKDGSFSVTSNAISPDGSIFFPAGMCGDTPLVIENDGSVREMTAQEMKELSLTEFAEFSASSDIQIIDGIFNNNTDK